MLKQWVLLVVVIVSTQFVMAQDISLQDVLFSIENYYPEVLLEIEKTNRFKNKVIEKKGVFDTKLEFDSNSALDGYYPGSFFRGKIKQDIPWSGVSIFGAYRKGFGEFPSYEGELDTLNDGEISAGIEWSVFESFSLDPKLFEVMRAEYEKRIQIENQRNIILRTQYVGAKAYFNWLAAENVLLVYKNLLDLAEDRQKALVKKQKVGDIAQIYVDENHRYIFERKRKLLDAQRRRDQNLSYLGIFLRDKEGKMKFFKSSEVYLEKQTSFEHTLKTIDRKTIFLNPILSMAKFEKELLEKELKNYRLNQLPNLKVKAKYSKDLGNGNQNLEGNEVDVSTFLSFPLQNRKNKSKLFQAKRKIKELDLKLLLEKDKLSNRFKILKEFQLTTIDVIENVNQEIRLSKRLAIAERKRWESGDSNFLLVNLREQDVASTKIQLIKANLDLQKTLSEVLSLTDGFKDVMNQKIK